MSTMEYENDRRYDADEPTSYRERSRSPRPDRDSRMRSASPAGRDSRGPRDRYVGPPPPADDEEDAANPGSNLFVTGIDMRINEDELKKLFEKYGDVETCAIMRDPHTRDSRGFGFVKMVTSDQADAAMNGLQGEKIEQRVLSIEKARRAKPRTPTPGKYFGPPKREDDRRGGGYGGRGGYDRRGGSRYDDRRRGYGGYGGERRGYDRYEDRRDERPSEYRVRDYDAPAPRGYGGASRDDRYAGGERRGGGYGGGRDYDRRPAYADADAAGGPPPPRRDYGDDDRYSRR